MHTLISILLLTKVEGGEFGKVGRRKELKSDMPGVYKIFMVRMSNRLTNLRMYGGYKCG